MSETPIAQGQLPWPVMLVLHTLTGAAPYFQSLVKDSGTVLSLKEEGAMSLTTGLQGRNRLQTTRPSQNMPLCESVKSVSFFKAFLPSS
jgi:hypothetical protein